MIKLHEGGVYLVDGQLVPAAQAQGDPRLQDAPPQQAKKATIAYSILQAHNHSGDPASLQIRFDALASHDITYVGIIQTARASGMEKFPMPYVLTCCHNSLCAVGGTINEDDHMFGLTAAQKYGGIYVPPHVAVIHQYMREMHAGCGKMILGSDSHTRYGALGTMAVGEGGGELDKQILGDTWDSPYPEVVAIYLTGKPQPWVGPHDIALAICKAVYANGYVKNKVMEFVGPGVASMDTDYRNGVDVMTTETTCLTSIWQTDGDTKAWLTEHGRGSDYQELKPGEVAYYDGCVEIDLSAVKPMIALPFHPSNAYTIDELKENLTDILRETEKAAEKVSQGRAPYTLLDKVKDGQLQVQQGVIGGCAGGTFTSIAQAANVLRGKAIGAGEFTLNVYPSSIPVYMELMKNGALADLMAAGSVVKTAFCGPCFGAGDTPNHNGLSIRHTTRNFPNREGSKPGDGQLSGVVLMDARSIAATARNHGVLTPATEVDYVPPKQGKRTFDTQVYDRRVYFGFGHPQPEAALKFGPNIAEWPPIPALADNLLMQVASVLRDPVTTTDELIPSGETSSYRSNPMKLASFALSRRDPNYVPRALDTQALETARQAGSLPAQVQEVLEKLGQGSLAPAAFQIGSVIFANKPGDGSAREQAASCQRVLGGCANICYEFATKRYRSNCVNWGMLPFTLAEGDAFTCQPGDFIYVPDVKAKVLAGDDTFPALALSGGAVTPLTLYLKNTTGEERELLLTGCLMNHYAAQNQG